MTPDPMRPLDPPRGLSGFLRRVLGDDTRAMEVLADLEELARKKGPRLPGLFYWRGALALGWGLLLSRLLDREPPGRGRTPSETLRDLGMDLAFTVRGLVRRPGPALTVVVTLGLAVGFNAAVLAVLRGIALDPLPFPDAHGLVVVDDLESATGVREDLSGPELLDLREATTRLSALAGWRLGKLARTGDGPPESLTSTTVTDDLFQVLRVPARGGRTLLPGDQGIRRAVLSFGYWTNNLAADPAVVGSSLVLDGQPWEVVGIMPPGFTFPQPDIDVWIPAADEALARETRASRTWNALGRLAPGATLQDADAELDRAMSRVARSYPESRGWEASVREAGAALREAGNLPLLLFGAVAVVLLIACVNVANVLFVRAVERTRDTVIRAALGASPLRLARFVVLEALVLAVSSGALGILVGFGIVAVLNRADPGLLPTWEPLSFDWRVGLFSLAIASVVALVAGALPALHVARPRLAGSLAKGGNRASSGKLDRGLRNALVTAQIALTLVLLHGAGLLLWSLYQVTHVDPGFERNGILTATAVLRGSGSELTTQYEQIMERIEAIPGVLSAGTVSSLPMNPVGADYHADAFSLEYPERTPLSSRPEVEIRVTSPGYLETMGIALMDGRSLSDRDRPGTPLVALVNEELARRYYPEGDAVGMHLAFGSPLPPGIEIVGVVANVKHDGLDRESRPEAYIGFLQMPHNDLTFAIRTLGDPLQVAPAVRRAVAEVAPDIPLVGIGSLDAVVDGSLAKRRFSAWVFGSVAALGILLATLGIYGVTSYAVSLREREFGIRQAIGAGTRDVLASVLARAFTLVSVGALLGVGGALLVSRSLEAQLFGIQATSVPALVAAALAVGVIGVAGSVVPATRAVRADPLSALQEP